MIAVSKKTRTIARFSYSVPGFACARKTPPGGWPGPVKEPGGVSLPQIFVEACVLTRARPWSRPRTPNACAGRLHLFCRLRFFVSFLVHLDCAILFLGII
jgi:hypothetical protein